MVQYRLEADIIAAIYEAAVHPETWPQVARLMADFVGAQMCYLYLDHVDGMQRIVNHGLDPAIHEKYLHFMDGDIWLQKASILAAPTAVLSDDLIPLAEFKKTAFFNELCMPADVAYLGAVVAAKNGLETIIYSCHRSETSGPLSRDELQSMARFSRHVSNATFLTARLQSHENEIATLRAALDHSRYGIVFCHGDGRVTWENRTASRILSQADGLKVVGGRLLAQSEHDTTRLSNAIRRAALTGTGRSSHSGGRLTVQRNQSKLSYKLTVMPGSQSWTVTETPSVVVFIADPSAPPIASSESLKQFYGLTDAEVRICAQIALGRTVPEIADCFSLSKNTIRTQLKSIFRKCDISSQVQLMGLLATVELC